MVIQATIGTVLCAIISGIVRVTLAKIAAKGNGRIKNKLDDYDFRKEQ